MNPPPKIAVLASGEGTNFQAIVEAAQRGDLKAQIAGLITNRAGVGALERAQKLGIPSQILDPKKFSGRDEWDSAVVKTLQGWNTDWVVLAGFLVLVGPKVLKAYPERVVNVHPALLPRFGGPGMYGMRVHQAVLEAGAVESGITVHLVDLEYDRGRIVAQVKISLNGIASSEALAAKIQELEHRNYPRVLNDLVWGRLTKP
jgi:phosphoribosylglycinamide formyltransferase-1